MNELLGYVEPSKWSKLPKLIGKAVKKAQDQQKARIQSVKEILQQALAMKKDLKMLIKEQKSKNNPPSVDPYPPPAAALAYAPYAAAPAY